MTRRYVTRARYSDAVEEEILDHNLVVYESDEPIDTGLLDHHGNRIYAVTDKAPIGFMRRTDR